MSNRWRMRSTMITDANRNTSNRMPPMVTVSAPKSSVVQALTMKSQIACSVSFILLPSLTGQSSC